MTTNTYWLTITLSVNRLHVPIKRHTEAKWIRKQDPYICCLQETHFRSKDAQRLKVEGFKKRYFMKTKTNQPTNKKLG